VATSEILTFSQLYLTAGSSRLQKRYLGGESGTQDLNSRFYQC
jgi:hypothetical protein